MNDTAILITTRFFDKDKLSNHTIKKSLKITFDEIINNNLSTRIETNAYRAVFGESDINNCKEFFNKLRKYTTLPINYDGKLRNIKDTNIFFYHHYPDKQLPEKKIDDLPSAVYIAGLVKEITLINSTIKNVILVLHLGDLLRVSNEVFKNQINIAFNLGTINISIDSLTIYTFSHANEPIWTDCLCKPDFFDNTDDKELHLKNWLDPVKANEFFNIFSNKK